MSGKIHVQCYKCKTVYELEYGLRGRLVECAVCDAVFEIPQLGEEYKIKAAETDIAAENEEQTILEGENPNLKTTMGIESSFTESKTTKLSTKTIRLPKTRYGMLPEVDDKFGTERVRNPSYHKKRHQDSEEGKAPKAVSKWWPWGKKKK